MAKEQSQPTPTYLIMMGLVSWNTSQSMNRYLGEVKCITEQVKEGDLEVRHIGSMEMPGNGLSKPLNKEKHANFVSMMRMVARKVAWVD